MEDDPGFVLEQSARDDRLVPEPSGREPLLSEELRESDRGIQVDHGSSRLFLSSSMSSANGSTGFRGGGPSPGSVGGFSRPSRTISASFASSRTGLRPSRGGMSSATTRSRSVISTV